MPEPFPLGPNSTKWVKEEIEQWIEERKANRGFHGHKPGKGKKMSIKLNESQVMACNLLATGMKTSDILNQLKIRPETLSRWKQNEEFINILKNTGKNS